VVSLLLLGPAIALLLALPAAAATGRPAPSGPALWATVNVCDTELYSDTIGIRGSMPGSGRKGETMWMRFRVQLRAAGDGGWHGLADGGDSGWRKLGPATTPALESGYSFSFAPPADEPATLRGVVSTEWRRGSRVMAKARRVTEAGHRSGAGADPAGASAGLCVLTSEGEPSS
jgi:hypothetical protein